MFSRRGLLRSLFAAPFAALLPSRRAQPAGPVAVRLVEELQDRRMLLEIEDRSRIVAENDIGWPYWFGAKGYAQRRPSGDWSIVMLAARPIA